MRRDYPATLSSPAAVFSLPLSSFSFLLSSTFFSPFSYVSSLSLLNQEGVHNTHCVLVPLVLFFALCSGSVTLRCCTESRCWGLSVTLTRPSAAVAAPHRSRPGPTTRHLCAVVSAHAPPIQRKRVVLSFLLVRLCGNVRTGVRLHPPYLCSVAGLTFFYSNFRSVYLNLPSRSTFLYRISCLTNVYVFLYIYIEMHRSARSRVSHWLLCRFFFFFLHASRLFTCLQTSKELAVLVYTQRSACFPFLNFTPRPFLAAPPARFERVTVVSRAKASPTRAGTHTRTCVQRGTSMIVCATTLPSFPRAGFTNGAKHFCA